MQACFCLWKWHHHFILKALQQVLSHLVLVELDGHKSNRENTTVQDSSPLLHSLQINIQLEMGGSQVNFILG